MALSRPWGGSVANILKIKLQSDDDDLHCVLRFASQAKYLIRKTHCVKLEMFLILSSAFQGLSLAGNASRNAKRRLRLNSTLRRRTQLSRWLWQHSTDTSSALYDVVRTKSWFLSYWPQMAYPPQALPSKNDIKCYHLQNNPQRWLQLGIKSNPTELGWIFYAGRSSDAIPWSDAVNHHSHRQFSDASDTTSEVKWKKWTRVGGIFFDSIHTLKKFLL